MPTTAPPTEADLEQQYVYLDVGAKVWIKSPRHAYVLCDVVGVNREEKMARVSNVMESAEALVHFSDTAPFDASHTLLYDDCCEINLLHEAPLIHLLKRRFEDKDATSIYTWCGDVLISINPYKHVPHEYDVPGKMEEEHTSKLRRPHPYAVASKVLEKLSVEGNGQSIIVNGESGAGKTELVKTMMRYLGSASNLVDSATKTVEDQMMNANPLLEAFGNAKTVRNNNSSRFGKYQKLFFDQHRSLVGGEISHFLLEKGRVVQQNTGERNYHIFYQLCNHASEELKQELCLSSKSSGYVILNGGRQDHAEEFTSSKRDGKRKKKKVSAKTDFSGESGINDEKGFKDVLRAFQSLRVGKEEQKFIFKLLSIILHLGELRFIASDDEEVSCVVENREMLNTITSKLLSSGGSDPTITSEKLEKALTFKTWQSGHQNRSSMVAVPLTPAQSADACDAMAKVLYEKLFEYIVSLCNRAMSTRTAGDDSILSNVTKGIYSFFTGEVDSGSLDPSKCIGMLDIQGFELLEINRLEQLCINYANEILQGLFIHHLFELEYKVYESEGIEYEKIDFDNNKMCIDLLVKKPVGIFHLLDETSMLLGSNQKVDDYTFLSKVHSCHLGKNENFIKPKFKSTTFQIKHFAGVVAYNCNGFLLANADPLNIDCIQLLTSATEGGFSSFVCNLFSSFKASKEISSRLTISRTFRSQLKDLNKELGKSDLHFVRCIKPNDLRYPLGFDAEKVSKQLKYGGIIDYINLRNKGFPVRMTYEQFKQAYKSLDMLKKVEETSYQRGRTLLFMKKGVIEFLDHLMHEQQQKAVIVLQKAARKKLATNRLKLLRDIHERALAEEGRKRAARLKFKHYAKTVIIGRRRALLKELLKYGGTKDSLGKLHAAAKIGETSAITKLVSENPELAHEIYGSAGKSLLISAIEGGNESTVRAVLRMNPLSVSIVDAKGLSPIHVCAKFGFLSIAKLILDTSNERIWEMRKAKMEVNKAIINVNNNKYHATVVGLMDRKDYGTASSVFEDFDGKRKQKNILDLSMNHSEVDTESLRKTKSQLKGKLMQGWLEKRRDVSLWKRRWVEITRNSLRYYKRNKILNMLDRKKRGAATVIDLRVAMLSMDKDYKHSFALVSPHLLDAETNPQGRLHFRCVDDEELNKWVSVLRNLSHVGYDASLHVVNRNLKPSFWNEQVEGLNSPSNTGESPLVLCSKHCMGAKGAKMAAWLIEHGAQIHYRNIKDKNMTPLHYAIKAKNYAVAKVLLRRGANPNLKDSKGASTLSFCSPEDADCIVSALESKKPEDDNVVDIGILAKTMNLSQMVFSDIKKLAKETGKRLKKGNDYRRVQSRPTLLTGDVDVDLSNPGTDEVTSTEISSIKKIQEFRDRSSLLSLRNPSFGDSYLSVYIEQVGGENLQRLQNPFIAVSVIKYTTKGEKSHERIQVTDLPIMRDSQRLYYFSTYNMQTPLEQVGDDAAIILELRAFDQYTGRPKTIIWTKQQILSNRKLTFFTSQFCLQGYFPPVDKSAKAERVAWLTSRSSNSFFSGVCRLHTLKL